jgi:hypothetical protein
LRPIKPDILLAGIALHGPAAKPGSIAMVQISIFERQGRADTRYHRGVGAWMRAAWRWLSDTGQAIWRTHLEAELKRKLDGASEHMLRDMGLQRTGAGLESIDPNRSIFSRTDG